MTRILLVDDHAVVRKGLKETLEEIPGVVVRAEAGNAGDALTRLSQETASPAASGRPSTQAVSPPMMKVEATVPASA